MSKIIKIAITTGDEDGIGTEVVSLALQKLRVPKNVRFLLFRSPRCPQKYLKRIDSAFNRHTVNEWHEALQYTTKSSKDLIDINSSLHPAKWVELCAKSCMLNEVQAIATAPISKTSIIDSGRKQIGHTEILKRISSSKDLFMTFIGSEFNVLLITGHIPVSQVGKNLSAELIVSAMVQANRIKKQLHKSVANKPIALLGLNPHAGEDGIIGDEEQTVFAEAIKKIKSKKIAFEGPLVPDAVFFKQNWKKYSIFVCPYHDQGLIPFKMIHEQDSGVHITMGLPFVRTSVDHGTAKDIFGKNKANPNSMIESLKWAIKLSQS